jgi:peptide/nickel transport system substrate-binding protein
MAGLFFNMKKTPFSDLRFRRAVSLAIDRAEFYRALAPNLSHLQAGYGLMPAATKWNLSKEEFGRYPGMDTFPGLGGNAEANRLRARSLLKELGVADGTKVKIMARADLASFTAPAIIITEHLKKIGLSAEVDMAESGTFYQRESNLDFDMVFHSMGLAGLFPDAILGEAWTSVGARNYAQWKNLEIDELFERQSGEPDEAKRRAIIFQMARLHLDNMYWLFMNQSLQYRAHTEKVKGWLPHSGVDDNYHFDAMWLDQ